MSPKVNCVHLFGFNKFSEVLNLETLSQHPLDKMFILSDWNLARGHPSFLPYSYHEKVLCLSECANYQIS